MSAYGLLAAPLAFDFVRTRRQRLDTADWPGINALYAEMEAQGRALLARASVAPGDVRVTRLAEMRYLGQGHEVEAAIPLGALAEASLPAITAAFEAAYRALYHRLPQGVPIEVLNWRVTMAGPRPQVRLGSAGRGAAARPGAAIKAARPAYFAEAEGFVTTPVYDRYRLGPGDAFSGPAIVEERESTAVIGPGARCRVDDGLALVVDLA
jgi:N-methylhydantoinase A